MPQKKSRRKFSKKIKKDAVQMVKDHKGNIDEVAKKLDIHPFMLNRWCDESEGGVITAYQDETYSENYKIHTVQDLLSRYLVHLWKNQYFNISETFEPDPKTVTVESLQLHLLMSRIDRPAYDFYDEESWLSDLLPGYPELEPMIKELRKLKVIDLHTASKVYDKWQKKFSLNIKSEEKGEEKRIKKLSVHELCFTILENFDFRNIHLNDRDIENYTDYYMKMKSLYFNEVKWLAEHEKQHFLIERMLEWSRKFDIAASDYILEQAKLESSVIKRAFEFHDELKKRFQDLYKFMNTSDSRILLFFHPMKKLISEIMVFQAKYDKELEFYHRSYEDRVEVGRPEVFMERDFILELEKAIKKSSLHLIKYDTSKSKNNWIAELLNLMSNLKMREWQFQKKSDYFPFGNYTARKIEKALELTRNK